MILQHILVPVDFSPDSDAALTYAIEMARRLQARLTLFSVIQDLPIYGPVGVGDIAASLPKTYLHDLEQEATQSMEQRHQRVRQAGLPVQVRIDHGAPHQKIIDLARDQKVDLIIMGTHGRTGLAHMFIGSVAEKVVRLAPCAVLVTRHPEPAA